MGILGVSEQYIQLHEIVRRLCLDLSRLEHSLQTDGVKIKRTVILIIMGVCGRRTVTSLVLIGGEDADPPPSVPLARPPVVWQ